MNYMHISSNTLCDDLFEDCAPSMEVYNAAIESVDVSDQFDVQFTEVDDEKVKSDASGSNEIQKQNWFKSLISKIRTFVKNAIGNIKIVLNRLGNKIRLKKSTKMGEKVSKLNDTSKEIHVTMSKQDMNLLSMGAKKDISSAIADCIDRFYDLSGSKEEVSTIKKNSVAGIFPGLSSTGTLKTEQNAGGSGKFKMRINPIVVKRYLDNAVKYLSDLGNNSKILPAMQKMADSGKDMNKIRTASIMAYNIVTSGVKAYYQAAMRCASQLVKKHESSPGLVKNTMKATPPRMRPQLAEHNN